MNLRLLLTLSLLALGSTDFAAGFGYLPKVESASPPRRTPLETKVVPTAESVLELLGVLNFKSIFDGLVERQKDYLRAELEQDPARESLNSQQQAILAEFHAKALSVVDDELPWKRFEVLLLTAFQSAYSQSDVDALIAFYRSEPGRDVLAKVPLGLQAFTAERSAELQAIFESQGAAAAAAKSKEIIGVNFKPREIAGVCEFFNSPQGKHISAQMPKAMSQLQAGVVDMAKDTEIRMRAMAAEFESRIEAVADSPAAVTSK